MQLPLDFNPSAAQTRRRKKLATTAMLGMGAAVIAGVAAFGTQTQRAVATNAEAAATYAPSVEVPPLPDYIEVAFLGDSFTAGSGATWKHQRWTTLVAKEQGWMELNYGKGGTNYNTTGDYAKKSAYRERLTDLIVSDPDIVIVSSAGNTIGQEQAPGIRKTMQTLREHLPEARIVALSPFLWTDNFPEQFDKFAEDIEREVEAVDGEYIDIGDPLEDVPDTTAEDKIHPNDRGHKILAEVIGKKLD